LPRLLQKIEALRPGGEGRGAAREHGRRLPAAVAPHRGDHRLGDILLDDARGTISLTSRPRADAGGRRAAFRPIEEAAQGCAGKIAARSHLRHELRTPLNAIKGYGELLVEEASDRGRNTSLADLEKALASPIVFSRNRPRVSLRGAANRHRRQCAASIRPLAKLRGSGCGREPDPCRRR
jgi:signal transduction histidine kinase